MIEAFQPTVSEVYHKRVTLTSAEILAMLGTAVQLVGPPPPGKYIHVLDFAFRMNPGTIPYTIDTPATDAFVICYAGQLGTALAIISALQTLIYTPSTGNFTYFGKDYFLTPNDDQANVQNNGIFVANTGHDPTLGNGTLDIITIYTLEDMS